LEESFEKGSSRKTTENRVTSWRNLFWGNLTVLRCFTKRFDLGGFGFGFFWGFGGGSHGEVVRRGALCVQLGGILLGGGPL
jgi:hypothetical protein